MATEHTRHSNHHNHNLVKSSDSSEQSPVSQTSAPDDPENPWHYRTDQVEPSTLQPIQWSASEFIDHQKPAGWFMAVAGIGVLLAGVIYILTHDLINTTVIGIVVILFAVSGARRPRTLQYSLNSHGIQIGDKLYEFDRFRSFAVMDEEAINSIQLSQFKRFTTPITLYFPPEQQADIVNFIGSYLPYEVRRRDPIDQLMRKVRF